MSVKVLVSVFSLALVMGLGQLTSSRAAIVHESATLGAFTPTDFGSLILSNSQFLGSRFELTTTTQITGIGGHLFGAGNVFGAIVALTGAGALPSFAIPSDIGANALASALIDVTAPSQDILVSLSVPVVLNAGWYALIFGGGQFGAVGSGAMPANNTDFSGASYFFGNSFSWQDGGFNNTRFVVQGYAVSPVPVPAALPLFGTGLAILGFAGWRKRRRRLAA